MARDDTTLRVKADDGVVCLTLSRPARRNALDQSLLDALRAALSAIEADNEARAIVLTGEGSAFCAGADLRDFPTPPEGGDAERIAYERHVARTIQSEFNAVVSAIASARRPVIAAVNGMAVGGGVGLALATDVVLLGQSASFVMPFLPRLGLAPDMGAAWFMARSIGIARTRLACLTGDPIGADQAASCGLGVGPYANDQLMVEAVALARRLADLGDPELAGLREMLDGLHGRGVEDELYYEARLQGGLVGRPTFGERVAEFRNRGAGPR